MVARPREVHEESLLYGCPKLGTKTLGKGFFDSLLAGRAGLTSRRALLGSKIAKNEGGQAWCMPGLAQFIMIPGTSYSMIRP
jgi:hypothetical protein